MNIQVHKALYFNFWHFNSIFFSLQQQRAKSKVVLFFLPLPVYWAKINDYISCSRGHRALQRTPLNITPMISDSKWQLGNFKPSLSVQHFPLHILQCYSFCVKRLGFNHTQPWKALQQLLIGNVFQMTVGYKWSFSTTALLHYCTRDW